MSETEVKVPNIGDFKDVEIIEVLVSEGQILNKNDPLITIESDKSSVEIPSIFSGKIESLKVKVGDKVSKGDLILNISNSNQSLSTSQIIPKDTEKYMCEKHKVFFRMKLQEWKKELVKANNDALYNGSMDDNSISADIVDQASSYTDKNVEMKAINRQIKLISEIDKALLRIRDDTYGYCQDTAEPIGLKRLMARPVAKYTIAAQEKHEKNEKVHADD